MPRHVKCPACPKVSSERGIILHYEAALSGWDKLVWNEGTEPHVKWAQAHGVTVSEGYTFNYEPLKTALRQYFSESN